ncbi:lantibiotic dehydratase [Nocardiopsis suaedae]|uniref:Lantibiotic dehydratase n=1 Tax=Nocardiopsis suaedae TaxID=3018444 RepID=A0ABT4TJ20_9ACTN|nr:lantibiotic dehydratase [Nocardiopsis suaedae]MDA2804671.1 lantibiotic dehydratase [Nocardiopsis suaedae]
MNVNVSPYVLYRRNRLPFSELAGVGIPGTWAGVDEADALRAEAARLAEGLSERLGAAVPLAEGRVRTELVKLRRDVHNGRLDGAADRLRYLDERLDGLLDGSVLRTLREWSELGERARRRDREALEAFDAEKDTAAKVLAALFEHDSIAKSIQLSGRRLYQELCGFAAQGAGAYKPSKARKLESTLVNFAYRASVKPSPFGRFTEVGAFPADLPARAGPGPQEPPEPSEPSVATLSRFLLNWVVSALAQVPGGLELGVFLLNSTVQEDEGAVRFIGTAADASGVARAGDQVVRIKRDRVVARLMELLGDGPVPGGDVLRELAAVAGSEAMARRITAALMRTGMLFFRVPIDDQDPDYSRLLSDLLDQGTTDQTKAVAQAYAALTEAESRFPGASAGERDGLLRSAYDAIARISELCGAPTPPDALMRAPVYEDVPTRALPQVWDPDSVSRNLDALDSLWRFSSLLDVGQTKRLGLYSFAVRRFGDREDVPFLDFCAAFAQLSEREQWGVLTGRGSEAADRYAGQRDGALRDLRARMASEDGVAHLDPADVRAACDRVEDAADPRSVTFRLQFAADPGGGRPRPVVNGVFTGYGAFYSRFGGFVTGSGADGWALRPALRDHLARAFPDQVDLHAVLGFNFNLHPPLTERAVLYPGSMADPAGDGGRRLVPPARIRLRIDHASRSLEAWDDEHGAPLDLLPMNFLLPVGAPLVYQLLEALSPTTLYSWQPVADLREPGRFPSFPEGFDRLEVGGVVADRRTWNYAAEEVPGLGGLAKDSFDDLVRFDAWRRSQGLPRHAFVLCQTLSEFNTLTGRDSDFSPDWSDLSRLNRASVHKPMYVDFRNPFLVRSLARSALSRPDVFVSVRECLPSVEDYAADRRASAAEEYFVELYRDRS